MAETAPRRTFADRMVGLAHSRWLLPVLLLVVVLETSFVPLPYEAAFIALCLAARDRIWIFIAISVLGSAIGGSVIYALGATYFDPIIARLGVEELASTCTDRFAERGASFIFLGGTTPAPSYLINLIAGATGYPYWEFLGIFSASRFLRFAVLGGLLFLFGAQITSAWERMPKWLNRVLSIALIIGLIYWFVSGFSE
ncbi:MAG: VTT domain-containing protein [Henriciella sp.]|nr:VTT domain-containing protein [Henriciella sp.]